MDAQQIFAYTELKGPLPAYLNVSRPAYDDNGAVGPLVEVPDVVVTVRERRAQDNGADRPVSYCGVTARISLPMAELTALYTALGEFLQAASAAAHALTADLFAPQEGDAFPLEGISLADYEARPDMEGIGSLDVNFGDKPFEHAPPADAAPLFNTPAEAQAECDRVATIYSNPRVVLPGDETPEERITFDNPRAAADEG